MLVFPMSKHRHSFFSKKASMSIYVLSNIILKMAMDQIPGQKLIFVFFFVSFIR